MVASATQLTGMGPVFAPAQPNETDTYIIAGVIYSESRSEGTAGMEAVASTIWNRHNRRGQTLIDVAKAKGQYADAFILTGNLSSLPLADRRAWATCYALACDMLAGTFKPTTTATHFHDDTIKMPSSWERMTYLGKIGRLHFYRED